MVQTTSKVFIKDPYVQSRKYKCGNKKFGHETKGLWFENVDTTVALHTTASSSQTAYDGSVFTTIL